MDNYIIYHKVLELEKNKETALRIPAIFNSANSEFSIEINQRALEMNPTIELCFKDPRLSIGIEPINVVVELNGLITQIKPSKDFGLSSKDLLFVSVRSSATFKVAISIRDLS